MKYEKITYHSFRKPGVDWIFSEEVTNLLQGLTATMPGEQIID